MLRILAFSLAATLMVGTAEAQVRDALTSDLRNFVEAFELAQVPDAEQARLRVIVDHPEASHVAKVMAIHEILQNNGALRHVDMHGDAPTLHSSLLD